MSVDDEKSMKDLLLCTEGFPFRRRSSGSSEPLLSIYRLLQGVSKRLPEKIRPVHHTEITSHREIANLDLLSGRYAPKEVSEFIRNSTLDEYIYEHHVGRQEVRIHFFLQDSESYSMDKQSLGFMAKKAFLMTELLLKFKTRRCGRVLSFYIYLTPLNKNLPKDHGVPLGPLHSNTGFAGSCANGGSIVIYRKEEWFKVLTHELIHFLGLDFSTDLRGTVPGAMKTIFPVSSEFNLYETYTEVWAEILNIVMTFFLENPEASKRQVAEGTHDLIRIECAFSTFQMVKILGHLGLNYELLYSKSDSAAYLRDHYYKEKTNVFCYYVLPSLLLFYYDDFLRWCVENNLNLIHFSTQSHAQTKFVKLIEKLHDSAEFISFVSCAEQLYGKLSRERPNSPFLLTTRMSFVEN